MSTMKQKLFIILTFLMAVCSSDVFSQRHIPLFDSGQSYLGVQIRDITANEVGNLQLPGESGVFIVRVEEDSPAAQADLQEGDVILELGRFTVSSVRQFQRLVSETPPGRQVELVIMRQGQRISKRVPLEERKFSGLSGFGIGAIELPPWRWPGRGGRWFQREPDRPRLGIQGERLTEQLGEFLGVPGRKGVLLMEVVKDSPAEKAGLKAGDVIISVDGHPVQSVTDVTSYLKPGPIELEIIRDKQKQNITVELETRQRKRESMQL